MKRRDFIATTAIALAASAISVKAAEKSWRDMTPEELARENLRKRQVGIPPNYEQTHECTKCRASYLCPDRYITPSCAPTDWEAKFGRTSRFMLCLPCSARNESMRQLWYEAHGI